MTVPASPAADPATLYLDLLKRVLTGTLFRVEPDADAPGQMAFVRDFISHYIEGEAVSMLPLARFHNLEACIRTVLTENIPGDFIETGVWRGGACIFMRAALEILGDHRRAVWVADSFQGLPTPDAEKFPAEARAHAGAVMAAKYKHFAVDRAHVEANFRAFGMLDQRVRFLEGWFRDTLPAAPIGELAILRLDGDYYESTMDALTSLWDRLVPGGFVIIDDYGEESWTYCRQAVEAFRAERRITTPLRRVDSRCWFWRKERACAKPSF
jgi:hypothetical protein